MPNWPRWKVTLAAGAITTFVACFPFVFTKLLNFVGLYGLLLVPAGAIVMTEHWLFPRFGLTSYWAEPRGLLLNWPALIAWLAGMGLALGLYLPGLLHLFFLYVLTVVLYLVLASMAGARAPARRWTGRKSARPRFTMLAAARKLPRLVRSPPDRTPAPCGPAAFSPSSPCCCVSRSRSTCMLRARAITPTVWRGSSAGCSRRRWCTLFRRPTGK